MYTSPFFNITVLGKKSSLSSRSMKGNSKLRASKSTCFAYKFLHMYACIMYVCMGVIKFLLKYASSMPQQATLTTYIRSTTGY